MMVEIPLTTHFDVQVVRGALVRAYEATSAQHNLITASMMPPLFPPYSALNIWVKTRTPSTHSGRPRKRPELPAGEKPKTGSFVSIPSMRTLVQLGRMPVTDT
jgi:hypothetical protein